MNSQHAPQLSKNPASNEIVIFIHGLMGSPRQFAGLSGVVYRQGYSTAALLLPGHGSTAKDFVTCGYEQWQRHVDSEIERLSGEYSGIWLAGHSMGGLLAINATTKHAGNIRGILAISCPFKLTTLSAYTIKVRIKQLLSKRDDPIKTAYLANSSVAPSARLILHMRKPAVEVKKLIQVTEANLPHVCVPLSVVYSKSDELTSFTSLEILKAQLAKPLFEEVVLTDSLHAYFPDNEQKMIEQALNNLLSKA